MRKIIFLFLFLLIQKNISAVQVYPYLQSPTSTSIYICWQTAEDMETVILYGPTPSMGNSAAGETQVIANQTMWHAVKLVDLLPSTVYYYQIKTEGAESDVFKFRTPPANGSSDGHVRFGLLGDSRTVPTMYRQVINAMKEKMIEQFGEDVENHFNVVLNVGDIITSGGAIDQYKREYFDPIRPLSGTVPFMVSIGNHENEDPYYYQYMKKAGCWEISTNPLRYVELL